MYGFLKRERAIWCNSYSTRSTDSWDLIDLQNSAASFCSQCYYQESHWKYTELLEIFYHPKNQEYEKSFKKKELLKLYWDIFQIAEASNSRLKKKPANLKN